MFFDASSNIHFSFHNAGTEVLVCLDDYIVVTVFEKNEKGILSRCEVRRSDFFVPRLGCVDGGHEVRQAFLDVGACFLELVA